MSPKKGARVNRKSTEKLQSDLKEKAQKNKPVNFKVSIPLQNTEQAGLHVPILKGRRPPQFTKHLNNKSKVELANSVARQQLVKTVLPVLKEDNIVFIKTQKPRGRKKKVTFCNLLQNGVASENNTTEANSIPEKPTPPKTPRRILTRKRLADSKAQENAKRLKVDVDPELFNIQIKVEASAESTDLPNLPEPQIPPVAQAEPEPVTPKPKSKKAKPTVKQTAVKKPATTKPLPRAEKSQPAAAKKRGRKGKQPGAQASVETPSIVDQPKVTEAQVKITQNQKCAPGLIESRKSSIGSSSSKSWTRDISSSSNTTCIGSFGSNDFVRINKKLPVLKLTNIDSQVKKHQNGVREVATCAAVDGTDETASYLYECKSPDSEATSKQSNHSLGIHSLDLSTSSSRVLTQSRRIERSSDFTDESSSDGSEKSTEELDSDYTNEKRFANKKATKQLLSLTMEKLDQEIIQWMRSEEEYVNTDMLKFKDKMFDIMDKEFGVITHTQHIKEILKPAICLDSSDDCDDTNNVGYSLVKEKSLQQNATAKESTVVKEKSVQQNATVETSTALKEHSVDQKAAVKTSTTLIGNSVKESTIGKENTKECIDFVVPRRRPSRHLSRNSEGNVSNTSTKGATEDEMAESISNNYPYFDRHDDDDTLSLFAESISGFESSKMNTSTASVIISKPRPPEEYIPQHVKEDYVPSTERITYYPTKISEPISVNETMACNVTVCEKQNADSTSIYKQSISTDDAESYQDIHENIDLDTKPDPPDVVKKPHLMESYFEGMAKTRSFVFGKLCFYNLLNCCRKGRNGQCRFVHLIPTREQIKEKLNRLDERMLVQEYLLLRKWTELRRRYGTCYVEQCDNRRLTRILVEMAYDFIVKAKSESEEDTRLRVYTIEVTLLHLNTVELSICEDLLKLPIQSDQPNKTLLCDVFMATMSITQNFSRFKIVFLTLTYFMVDNDRSFNKDVVEHIMERVCILPFEEPIARALIQMMRLTKSDIFNNSMIGHFEKQISVSKDVYEEYMLLKSQCAFSSLLASSVVTDAPPLKVDTSARSDNEPQSPADSPDTTLDIKNNAAEEPRKPVITRTIGMNPLVIFNRPATSPGVSQAYVTPDASTSFVNHGASPAYDNPSSSQAYANPGTSQPYASSGASQPYVDNAGTDTSDDSVKLNIRQWRNRSIFPHILPPPTHRPSMRGTPTRGTRGLMRPQMRPPQRVLFNQRLVTFKSPSNFQNRHPGPKY